MKLNNDTNVNLPKLVETRLLIQANSGGGKSWLIRRILEQSHGKVQQIILDPEGEFSTLREKYDYILAGKGGDTPAEPRSAALLAHKLLELKVSAVIDLYELPPQERKRFVKLFLDAMINAPKHLYHEVLVVIDEAHIFAPEKEQSEAAGSVIDLCTRGRKRGFCAVLATQRISKLHKDAAAECNNKLIGRTGLDIDMKRAGEELGFTSKEQLMSLRKLKPGEFYAFGPAISDEVKQITVGDVKTSHPKIGARAMSNVTPPTPAIKKALGELANLPQEAVKEASTVAELKQQVKDLTLELKKVPQSKALATKVEKIEVPVVGKRALEGLKKAESGMRRILKGIKEHVAIVESSVERFSKDLEKVTKIPQNPQKIVDLAPKPIKTERFTMPEKGVVNQELPAITGPEQKILDALAWLYSIGVTEPEQTAVAFLAGYTFGGGGFNNPKGSLRTKGLIEYRGKNLALTLEGQSAANQPTDALTQDALHQKVLSVLPGPEQRLLKPLLDNGGQPISNEELAQLSGYQVGSGGFNNPKGRLRSLGLVEYPQSGQVQARSILFI